jgi:HK97 family phage portal protein
MQQSLFSRAAGWFFNRPALPPRYSDGWQAQIPPSALDQGSPTGLATFNRCAALIVGHCVSTEMLVFKGTQEAPQSTAAMVLRNTPKAHLEASFYDMLVLGNGWLFINRVDGVPSSLTQIQAHRMSAVLNGNEVEYQCDGKRIDSNNFIHLMTRNSYSPFIGEGILEQSHQSASLVISAVTIARQLQNNGSYSDMFLATDLNLSADQTRQLREAYNKAAGNAGASGGAVILSNGLKPMTVKELPSALEADIVKTLEFGVSEMARVFGIPLSFLSLQNNGQSYNSSLEEARAYYRNTLKALFTRIEDELTRKLCEGEHKITYDISDMILGASTERAETLSKLLFSGTISVNESRAIMKYSPVAGGDSLGVPVNSIPLQNWLVKDKPQAPKPANDAQKDFEIFKARKKLL